jgi:hypothetical protein
MPRRGTDADEDDITEAGASTFGGASIRGTRQVTPPPLPADLRTALASPTTFGARLFEVTALLAVATACKLNVKDAGDLLLLRDLIFEELGAPYMWINTGQRQSYHFVLQPPRRHHHNQVCLHPDFKFRLHHNQEVAGARKSALRTGCTMRRGLAKARTLPAPRYFDIETYSRHAKEVVSHIVQL